MSTGGMQRTRKRRFAEAASPAAALLLPRLPVEAYARLRASIAGEGVLAPIVVSAGPACTGEVADGLERQRACAELGIRCPVVRRRFVSEAEFCWFRAEVNLRRRNLDPLSLIRIGLALEPWQRRLAAGRRAQAKGQRRGVKSVPVVRPEESGETRDKVAAVLGVSGSTYQRGKQLLAEAPEALLAEVAAGRESIYSASRRLRTLKLRAERERLAAELQQRPPAYPQGRYGLVVVDPPWPIRDSRLPYPTMSLAEIAALPVRELLLPDAVVWLWTVDRFLEDSFALVKEWGLERKRLLVWDKQRPGTGEYLRSQSEYCLLCIKGRPLWTLRGQTTLLSERARQHSRKPEAFYPLVESLCPAGPRLELFARTRRPGWDCWGAEADRFPGAEAA